MADYESYDYALIRLVIDGGLEAFQTAQRLGTGKDILKAVPSLAWIFIEKYVSEYGSMPGLQLLQEQFSNEFNTNGANLEYTISHLMKRSMYEIQKTGLIEISNVFKQKDVDKTRTLIEDLADKMRNVSTVKSYSVKSMFDTLTDVSDQYYSTQRGESGIELPWPSVNAMCMGLQPATVSYFMGKPASGKSWTAIISSNHIWLNGHTVLFVSPEMRKVSLQERFLAVNSKLSYKNLVSGELGVFGEQALNTKIKELTDGNYTSLHLMDEPKDMNPRSIESAIYDLNPDVVILDSCYDIMTDIKLSRQDNMPLLSKWIRDLSRSTKKPIVAMSQLTDQDKAALSRQTVWDADNIFDLFQTPDMRDDLIMRFEPRKVRRPAKLAKVTIHWDFDTMDYGEISSMSSSSPRPDSADDNSNSDPWSF